LLSSGVIRPLQGWVSVQAVLALVECPKPRALEPATTRGCAPHANHVSESTLPTVAWMVPNPRKVVELRALRSTGSSAEGALGEVPEPDELVDFGSAVIPGPGDVPIERPLRCGRRITASWRTLCCAPRSAISCGEAGCSSACRSRPRLSLLFPRVPSCSFEASVAMAGRWDTARRKRHSRRSATCRNGRGDRI